MIGSFSNQCMNCKHLHREAPGMSAIHCDAFPAPEVIPLELQIEGDFDHTKPFPGDRGIRFDPPGQPAVPEPVSS